MAKIVQLIPDSVEIANGTEMTLRVVMDGNVGADTTILLDTSNAALEISKSVTVSSGTDEVSTTLSLSGNTLFAGEKFWVTARYKSQSVRVRMEVVQSVLGSIVVSERTVVGGNTVTVTVSLADGALAPAGGHTVNLEETGVYKVLRDLPKSVTILAGANSVTTPAVTTNGVSRTLASKITASSVYGGSVSCWLFVTVL